MPFCKGLAAVMCASERVSPRQCFEDERCVAACSEFLAGSSAAFTTTYLCIFGVPRNVHKSHKSSDIISSIIYSVAKALPHLARHISPRLCIVPGDFSPVSADDATWDPVRNQTQKHQALSVLTSSRGPAKFSCFRISNTGYSPLHHISTCIYIYNFTSL